MDLALGAALAAARLNGTKIPASSGPGPTSLDQAYAIQDAMTDQMGLPVKGWKIGATNPTIQKMMEMKGPFYGPLFERWIYPSPNRIPAQEIGMNIIETEFGFRMKSTLPERGKAYSEEDVAEAVETLYPALEIVDRRMPGKFGVHANWLVADGGANHAFCHGNPVSDWRDLDLKSLTTETFMDGESMCKGLGENALGSPLIALTWLANELNRRGKQLNAGDWVSTGTVAPVFEARLGAQVIADFHGLGKVELVLT